MSTPQPLLPTEPKAAPLLRRGSLREWWAVAVLLAGSLVVHAAELGGERPVWRDLHQVFVPARRFLADALARGEWPEWWPFDGAGSPFLAQSLFSTFHPTTVFFALLPFWPAFTLQRLASTALLACGVYALSRTLRMSRSGALLAASGVAFGGWVTCLGEFPFMHLATAGLGWYAWGLVNAQRRGGLMLLAPTAAMAWMLLAGDPQTAILGAGIGLALVLIRRRARVRGLLVSIGSPVAGAAIAAVQLLPALAMTPWTERRGEVLDTHGWSLGLSQVAGLAWPEALAAGGWGRSTYVGPALVVLAFVAALRLRRRPVVAAFLVVAALGAWLAIGDAGGLNPAVGRLVPIWSKFRYPVKSFVVTVLAIGILGGFGLDLASRRLALRRFAPHIALVSTLLSVVVVSRLTFTAPADFYEPSSVADRLRALGVGLDGPAFDRPFTSPGVTAEALALDAKAGAGGLGTSLGAVWGLPTITPSLAGASWRVLELWNHHQEAMRGRLLGAYGVGFVVLRNPPENLAPRIVGTDPASGFAIARLRLSLPRAYVVRCARAVADGDAAIEAVVSPGFAPGREIIVEGPADCPQEGVAASPSEVVSRTLSSVTVHATLPGDGYLVLNEAFFPGWTAAVDGTTTPVLVANALVRAVRVPAGPHDIVFTYRTPGLTAGLAISALSFCLAAGAAVRLRRRRRVSTAMPGRA